jgi:hypothetical protein
MRALLLVLLFCAAGANAAVLVCDPPTGTTVTDGVQTFPLVCTLTLQTTPPVPPTGACTGTPVTASMSTAQIQTLISSKPAGTTFCWASGTYVTTGYITLTSGSRHLCTPTRSCTLTGNMTAVGAFRVNSGTNNVRIQGFVIKDFATPVGFPNACIQVRDAGVMEDNEVMNCNTGMDMEAGATARGNFIHHNRQYGIAGGPGNNILIENNELSFNNTSHMDIGNDAGGSKLVGSSSGVNGLIWRGNYVHDNYGNGIWSDGNLINVTYENNRVENNGAAGINHEISWDAVIRNNQLKNNNTLIPANQSCWHGGEIALNNSRNVTISGNTLTPAPGKNGICMVNSTRSETASFPQFLGNISVTGNTTYTRGASHSGMTGDRAAAGISFSANTYYLDSLLTVNWELLSAMNKSQWQAAGQDTAGVFRTW